MNEEKEIDDIVAPLPVGKAPVNWVLVAAAALGTICFVGSVAWFSGVVSVQMPGQTEPAAATTAPQTGLKIKGNKNSRIYHLPSCPNYNDISPKNVVWFATHEEAKAAGFRMARNC